MQPSFADGGILVLYPRSNCINSNMPNRRVHFYTPFSVVRYMRFCTAPKPPLCKGRCPAGAVELSIPQSASLTACGPGRKRGLLPALAANSPPGCLFNASRPLRLTKCRRKAAVARLHAPAGAVHKGSFPNPIHNTKIRPMFVTIGRINCFMKPAVPAGLFL